MVGRYDGYQDEETKLKDAIKLLEAKQTLLDNYTQQNNLNSQKALMLLIAPSIEEAENIRTIQTWLDQNYPEGECINPYKPYGKKIKRSEVEEIYINQQLEGELDLKDFTYKH
ncbi:629_t:CDS:2, partial [Diversispora eburnea]